MHDPNDDDGIDRAYRAAVDTTEDGAAARLRRGAVLKAVQGLVSDVSGREGRPGAAQAAAAGQERTASSESRWHLSAPWWRGAAAACVIVSSALVVVHLREEPGVSMEPGIRPDADHAVPVAPRRSAAPAAPAHEAAAVGVPEAAPRQAPAAPAPAIVTGAVQGAPVVPVAAPTAVPSTARPMPKVEADRSAFPGNDGRAANAAGIIGGGSAEASRLEATRSPSATQPVVHARPSTLSEVERPEPLTVHAPQPPAASNEAFVGAAALPSSAAASEARTADVAAKTSPLRAARTADAAVQAPRGNLLAAVARGDIESARQILRATDPDAERNADGRTALAIAVLRSNLPLVQLLLAYGANPHVQDRFGQTPEGYADASADPAMLQAFGKP